MEKRDGHIHSPFCPHGSNDSLVDYIEQAISKGFTSITFTEHAPLPHNFIDPTPLKDSAMPISMLETYFKELSELKKMYAHKIKIQIGLEVDYIEGYENETKKFLDTYGPNLDDSILSVHFLKSEDKYFCLDFSPKMFEDLIVHVGSLDAVYHLYYETILKAITTNLGKYKPKRLGHLTLINKFQRLFPQPASYEVPYNTIFQAIKRNHIELDVNVAGLRKENCKETYPPISIIEMAKKENIPLVYGSDAHTGKDVGIDYHHVSSLL
ncbi:histidinol-phosphatase HisJ [Bacillus kexueae]|uniref:histidinol-phosphatase HisJ n=1 Tax=Aeribacillus kexueae TaxID=2078952 RepID=UPI001FAEB50F|nr:histidinol-phosphatase HisJ [Bacillus kexueae]